MGSFRVRELGGKVGLGHSYQKLVEPRGQESADSFLRDSTRGAESRTQRPCVRCGINFYNL